MILTCLLFGFGCVVGFITVSGTALAFLFWRARRAETRRRDTLRRHVYARLRRDAVTPLLERLEGADIVLSFVVGSAQVLWTKPEVEGVQ